MLRKMSDLTKFSMQATDGEIGSVHDFYFDDQSWTARYMVADAGSWLSSRRVLISPSSLGNTDWKQELLHINLTKEQIKNSPDVDTEKPVSRQQEIDLHKHYSWSPYWAAQSAAGGVGISGGVGTVAAVPVAPVLSGQDARTDKAIDDQKKSEILNSDPTLRSVDQVRGYSIQATDDEFGHVEDFFIDDDDWTIRYLLIDTKNWLPGRKVLISQNWISRISWDESMVFVEMNRQSIENSPEYSPEVPVGRDYESKLHEYYGRPAYWRM